MLIREALDCWQTTLQDPGLFEGCERYPQPRQRDDRGVRDRQQARYLCLERVPLEELSGVDHEKPNHCQHDSQPRAKGEDEYHPEAQPVERDRTEEQDERRGNGAVGLVGEILRGEDLVGDVEVLVLPDLIDLTDNSPISEVGYEVLEDVPAVRERAVDAEGDPVHADYLVRDGEVELRLINLAWESGDLPFADHPVGGARRRVITVFDPLGVVRVERHPIV